MANKLNIQRLFLHIRRDCRMILTRLSGNFQMIDLPKRISCSARLRGDVTMSIVSFYK